MPSPTEKKIEEARDEATEANHDLDKAFNGEDQPDVPPARDKDPMIPSAPD